MRGALVGCFVLVFIFFSIYTLLSLGSMYLDLVAARNKLELQQQLQKTGRDQYGNEIHQKKKKKILSVKSFKKAFYGFGNPSKLLLPFAMVVDGVVSSSVMFIINREGDYSRFDTTLSWFCLLVVTLVCVWMVHVIFFQLPRHPWVRFFDKVPDPEDGH